MRHCHKTVTSALSLITNDDVIGITPTLQYRTVEYSTVLYCTVVLCSSATVQQSRSAIYGVNITCTLVINLLQCSGPSLELSTYSRVQWCTVLYCTVHGCLFSTVSQTQSFFCIATDTRRRSRRSLFTVGNPPKYCTSTSTEYNHI
jgi:hypothetical protein